MKKRFRKVYIEITNVCNLNCKFCPKDKRKPTFMSVAIFNHVINEVKKYTDVISLHVKGEPLLHKELEKLLSICDENNIMVNLTTNGTLLKEKYDILLNSNSVRQVNVSIHSAVQNENINVTEYLNNVFTACDKLNKHSIISYRLWNINSFKNNEQNLEILNMLGKRYNIQNLSELAKENSYVKLKDNVFLNQDIEFKWPDIYKEEISDCGTCLGLKNQIAILSNGDVVPCCLDQNADILLGNILEKTLEEILKSEKSMNILRGFNNNKLVERLCKTCGYRKRFDKKR